MDFKTLWDDFSVTVAAVSFDGARKYGRFGATHEDFSQELALWMHKNSKKLVRKRSEMDDDKGFEKYLARCLRNEVYDYGIDVRAQVGGQDRQSAYWYSEQELKDLLPSMFDPEAWLNPPKGDGGRSDKQLAEGNNWIATLADVARAYDTLDIVDKDIIKAFYKDGVRNVTLAGEYSISEAAMSSRHHRALTKIHKALGGPKPSPMRRDVPGDPWRGRHAVSNAHARALTSSHYEGENS